MPQRLVVTGSGATLAPSVTWARSPAARARGLIGRAAGAGALVLVPARQVHTFGMRRPIDVVFCDRDWTVIYVVECLPPRRVTRWAWRARFVVELDAGTVAGRVAPGDRLAIA